MKVRTILVYLLLIKGIVSVACAGEMGNATTSSNPRLAPFITGEGAYSWYTSSKQVYLNNERLPYSHAGWGGRAAAGLELLYMNDISFSGELGWEYLAQSSATIVENVPYISDATYSGFDILVGTSYRYHVVDLFVKGGLFLLNKQISSILDYSKLQSNFLLTGNTSSASLHTFVLPEIKVGGFYNITDKWALSLAYMHIFGANSHYNNTVILSAESFLLTMNNNSRPPSFNTIQFGVRYYLA